jgi:hypothetical protein
MDIVELFCATPDGADAPREGFYEVDRRGKVGLPVRIWFGPPVDPDDGAYLLDRGPRWQMMVGDRIVDPDDPEWEAVWPQCAKSPLPEREYRFRMKRITYAKDHGARSDPWARRSGKIDLLTAPIPE